MDVGSAENAGSSFSANTGANFTATLLRASCPSPLRGQSSAALFCSRQNSLGDLRSGYRTVTAGNKKGHRSDLFLNQKLLLV